MIAQLQLLFIPHERNNHKPKILHLSSLAFLVFLIGTFQLGLTLLTKAYPGVLGVIANISSDRLVDITNQYRADQGLPALRVNPVLINAATSKAADMFAENYWSHNSPSGKSPWWFFKNAGYYYTFAGENLAKDFADPDSIARAWMDSPTHRDNILNNEYEEIGIAVVSGVLQGQETTLVVQLFGTRPEQQASVPKSTTPTEPEQLTYQLLGDTSENLKKAEVSQEEQGEPAEQYFYEEEAFKSEPLLSSENQKGIFKTWFSSFEVTKSLSLVLIGIVLVALLFDITLVKKYKIFRISGKSFIHFIFLAIILLTVWLTSQGKVL